MKKEQGFIKYIVIIAVILAIVYFSQQPYFRGYGQDLYSKASAVVQGYLSKGSNWAKDSLLPKIGGEVDKRGELIKTEVEQQKQNISETVGEKIKNYFSGVVDSVFGSDKNNNSSQNSQTNCQPVSNPCK